MTRYFTLLIITLGLSSLSTTAQTSFGCIDTLLIQAGAPCNHADYYPVCGCDNTTYRNGCYAYYNGVTSTVNGPCEPVDFDFKPNPVANDLFMTIHTQDAEALVSYYIYDLHGNLYDYDSYRTYAGITQYDITLNISAYERGIYIIMVQSRDYFTLKKFVKHTIE